MLARLAYRYPLLLVAGWLVLLALLAPWAPRLTESLQGHGLLAADGEHAQVQRLLQRAYGIPADAVIVLFERQPSVTAQAMESHIRQTVEWLRRQETTATVVSPLEQAHMRQGNSAYALLSYQAPVHSWAPLLVRTAEELPSYPGIAIRLTGQPAIQAEVDGASSRDIRRAELIGLPAALAILLIAFGGLIPAIIPIVAGLAAVGAATGIVAWLATRLTLSSFVPSVIPMVGLALTLDFALLLVSRYREELACSDANSDADAALTGSDAVAALTRTMRTAGRSVSYAAGAVALALLGTLWIPMSLFRSVALAALVALGMSLFAAWTLVPALLRLLTPSLLGRTGTRASSRWPARWATRVMRHPRLAASVAALLLLLCCLPLAGLRLAIPDAGSLPSDSEARIAYERYAAVYEAPGQSTLYGALTVTDGTERSQAMEGMEGSAQLAVALALVDALREDPLVTEALALPLPPTAGHPAFVRFRLAGEPGSSEVSAWLRERGSESVRGSGSLLLGGEAKYRQEVQDLIYDHLGKTALSVGAASLLVLLLAFRSVVIALKTLLLNLLSLAAAFGLLTWFFDVGVFGLTAGPIAIMIPVFIFGLAFSISMDYAVFLVSRIYEAYQRTGDNESAVVAGLAHTGRIITCAAAILIAVTLPFGWGEVAGVQQLGLGIALAIFIDATLIRFLLLPALMKLLGLWNWWGPRLRR
ncbi:hypothetical protein PA598K_02827 [Paenibacillus sp. 598K]|uniref:MMPL family transporter n=1 Tax=Paenibacillus sp. 598K TaxID=1117987 RepID=UPI000FF9748D|nr:MMPL family transporter [Paenibacillus sp. 598K]GBF74480.1 hypothetical protein PA598K_02827 [Paenibacillus sp. 598K]